MKQFIKSLFGPSTPECTQQALAFLRVAIGILTVLHGYPKFMGGQEHWEQLGMFINALGIYFLPVMWGFLGMAAEFFGGMALVLGLATRLTSAALTFMMFVAMMWHITKGDPFMVYSFPLSLVVLFLTFTIIGGGTYSVDAYLTSGRKVRRPRRKKAAGQGEPSNTETQG